MTRTNQKKFVRQLCASVVAGLVADIDAKKTLKTWDGHELRQLIAERFTRQQSPVFSGWSKRRREYINHCLVNNL